MVLFDVESIANAIYTTSVPLWITVLLAVLPIFATVFIFLRQNKIIKEQLKVANRQNDIALFEKRYEIYRYLDSIVIGMQNLPKEFVLKVSYDENLSRLQRAKYLFDIFFREIASFDCHDLEFESKVEEEQINLIRNEITQFMIKLERLEFLFKVNEQELQLYNDCLATYTTIFANLLLEKNALDFVIGREVVLNSHHLIAFDKLHLIVSKIKEQLRLADLGK